jgi:hypothetical protein
MLLFTWKTRRLIDSAVRRWGNEGQKALWQAWASENPQLRRPGGIIDDGGAPSSPEIMVVIRTALEQAETDKRSQLRRTDLSEDEIADIENDLSYIKALLRDFHLMPMS